METVNLFQDPMQLNFLPNGRVISDMAKNNSAMCVALMCPEMGTFVTIKYVIFVLYMNTPT